MIGLAVVLQRLAPARVHRASEACQRGHRIVCGAGGERVGVVLQIGVALAYRRDPPFDLLGQIPRAVARASPAAAIMARACAQPQVRCERFVLLECLDGPPRHHAPPCARVVCPPCEAGDPPAGAGHDGACEVVQGAAFDPAQIGGALVDFQRCRTREGHERDAFGGDPALDDVPARAGHHGVGFPGPGPGDDQHPGSLGEHRRRLLAVERSQRWLGVACAHQRPVRCLAAVRVVARARLAPAPWCGRWRGAHHRCARASPGPSAPASPLPMSSQPWR